MFSTKNMKKGFTLVELIIVMVIVAILGAVGFGAMQNYTANANLTKEENRFSEMRNAVTAAFAKGITKGDIVWSVDVPNTTNTSPNDKFLSGAIATVPTASMAASSSKELTINGEQVQVLEMTKSAFDTAIAHFTAGAVTNVVVLDETAVAGTVQAHYYRLIANENLCKSEAFAEKPTTGSVAAKGAGGTTCILHNATPITVLSK